MSELTILPTGTCFDDAMLFLMRELRNASTTELVHDRYVIVHAICRGTDPLPGEQKRVQRDDRFYAHAWVVDQRHGQAIAFGLRASDRAKLMMRVAVDEFHKHHDVYETWTYYVTDLQIAALADLKSGPYNARLFALCGDHDTEPKPKFMEIIGTHVIHKKGAP